MRTKRRGGVSRHAIGAPFLRRITSLPEKADPSRYPFNIRAFSRGIDLPFRSKVAFFVGENGSGKSTLLEAVAECCGVAEAAREGNACGASEPLSGL